MTSLVPRHIGIIMDGNRRWARSHGLPTLEGHRRGYEKIKKVGDWCLDRGVKVLSVFAFSTENWNRSKREVTYLMHLLRDALRRDTAEFHAKGVKMVFSGRLTELSRDIQNAIANAVQLTKNNTRGTLNICINYGGQPELIDVMKTLVRQKISPASINERLVNKLLYVPELPDPDVIIRTSGEHRLSGFLTWQSVYSELFFVKKHWPAFGESDLDQVIKEFNQRQRRFGG